MELIYCLLKSLKFQSSEICGVCIITVRGSIQTRAEQSAVSGVTKQLSQTWAWYDTVLTVAWTPALLTTLYWPNGWLSASDGQTELGSGKKWILKALFENRANTNGRTVPVSCRQPQLRVFKSLKPQLCHENMSHRSTEPQLRKLQKWLLDRGTRVDNTIPVELLAVGPRYN